MRLVHGDVNVYFMHDTLTPNNVRAASYGTASSSGALVPEVGDILHNFPGWTGEEYEPITVRVIEVKSIGDGVEAYEVRTTTVPADDQTAIDAARGKCQCSSFPMAGGAADCPNHVPGAVPV